MRFVLLPAAALLALSACATPESRVRTALLDAGLSRPVATCMAQRLVDRLSLGQLQRLTRLAGLRGERIGDLTVGEFLRRARTIGDPEILAVLTTSGLGCAIAA